MTIATAPTRHLRIFFPQELVALLHYAGFGTRQWFGTFEKGEFASGSPHQIVLAQLSEFLDHTRMSADA